MYELDRFDFAIVWKNKKSEKEKDDEKSTKRAIRFCLCCLSVYPSVPLLFDLPDCLPSYPFVLKKLLDMRTNI